MFTGIIEEKGSVEHVVSGSKSFTLKIKAEKIFDDLKLGDSVAVNGVCLTATTVSKPYFTADVMAETVRRTNLGSLVKGSKVNLERAMSANGRFGGHIVSGHIDGRGTVLSTVREENAVWVKIAADADIMQYIIEKGSVTLDGISLTVAKAEHDSFSVSVIPHTASETTLTGKRSGDKLNIECDIIGKYVEKLMHKSDGITEEFLRENGF